MKKKIDNPKVFISYAWGDEDYQAEVLAFASKLVGDGINVILDKWDLSEGNDTYAFMEKCVNDPTVTNVLMLLDPLYAKKADDHQGGVGTETQIISAKVYKEVLQDKFLPVVMRRDNDGNVCKPTYLEGRLHFDLTIPENYDFEYTRLVKKLYGEEVYAKPNLGKKPEWVDKPLAIVHKAIVSYVTLKGNQPDRIKNELFARYLNQITEELVEFIKTNQQSSWKPEEYISLYDSTQTIRDKYLQLLQYSIYVDDSSRMVASFLEETLNAISANDRLEHGFAVIRLHELFIYTIAYYLKIKDYSSAGCLLGKTYFSKRVVSDNHGARNFNLFYSDSDHTNLDNAVRARDKKQYHTGTGQHWIDTLASEFCSKDFFVFADLICFNYSIYGKDYHGGWLWFPLTYVYENRYNSELVLFAHRLVSKQCAKEILPLFGYDEVEQLIEKFKEQEASIGSIARDYRYGGAFDSARLIGSIIKPSEIASLK